MTTLCLSHAFFVIGNKPALLHSSFISISSEIWPLGFLHLSRRYTHGPSAPVTQTRLRGSRNRCLPGAVRGPHTRVQCILDVHRLLSQFPARQTRFQNRVAGHSQWKTRAAWTRAGTEAGGRPAAPHRASAVGPGRSWLTTRAGAAPLLRAAALP